MMKKSMMALLVLLLALAAIGAGFARWSDTLQIRLDAESGNLSVGVRCLDCGNLGQEPCRCKEDVEPPEGAESEGMKSPEDVKPPVISCSTGSQVCKIKGVSYYEYVDINIHYSCDCCSCQTPFCNLEIGNEGTIPARIKDIHLDWYGQGGSLKKWKAYFPNGETSSGVDLVSLQEAVNAALLEPEQTMRLDLEFSYGCSSDTCRIRVDYSLWNRRF